MAQVDWSRFTLKIYISTKMENVYQMFNTQKGMEDWFLRKAIFTSEEGVERKPDSRVEERDTYKWTWHGHPDETLEQGTITEANGKDRFQFIFGQAGLVTFVLKDAEGDTEFTIHQEHIPTDDAGKANWHVGCSTGWTFYLANIKSILEGGLDLRNKRFDRKGVINS